MHGTLIVATHLYSKQEREQQLVPLKKRSADIIVHTGCECVSRTHRHSMGLVDMYDRGATLIYRDTLREMSIDSACGRSLEGH